MKDNKRKIFQKNNKKRIIGFYRMYNYNYKMCIYHINNVPIVSYHICTNLLFLTT